MRNFKKNHLIVIVIFALLLCSFAKVTYAKEAAFYVSTDGNDKWSGTLDSPNAAKTDGPFATLARVRDAVRKLKESGQTKDITVLIRGGRYYLRETVVFGLKDSAEKGHTITYASYPGEEAILSSGVQIEGWKELGRDVPQDLPEMAKTTFG